ncbi:hypothetical protein Poli38472_006459 [Pythium oligandrum]|uniref:Enkurin domain-containing protein n=1 Tax=Pythium oligandrum TaxID=41045 RepID=A0A8K1C4T6_PYTOL|nr:hypothetical protein Poli38472_006459 [Pythium oligandrum]|eukprot:TMW56449.1 hypothetical protein Poli38472_006459 [Pythium oligandrum]
MSAATGFRLRDANASDAVAALLHPNMGYRYVGYAYVEFGAVELSERLYREQLRRRGIEPKDFEKANRLQVKRLQAEKREQRRREEAAKREQFKLTRFKSVQPRVYEEKKPAEVDQPPKRHEFLRRGGSAAALLKNKRLDQPASTLDSARTTAGGSQSLRCPSPARPNRHVKPPVPTRKELEELNEKLAKLRHKESVDYVNSNAWEVIKKSPPKPIQDDNGQNQVHSSFGRIPEYLLQRKEQWAFEEEERRRNAPDPDCPPGMVRLDEDERVKTLGILHQSYEAARRQMSALPLRIETFSQIRRKNELEARLQEIEDAIKVFSKTKVYVAKPIEDEAPPVSSPSPVRSNRRRPSNAVAA